MHTSTGTYSEKKYTSKRGVKTDHLGNVLTVFSDKKIPHSTDNTAIDYWKADVVSASDYSAFGSIMPGRSFNSNSYRFGFNGKEKDPETVTGGGPTYDYGFRIYHPGLGRFLSVDPLTRDYPGWSPYPYAMNRPIDGVDLDGTEWVRFNVIVDNTGKTLSFTIDDYTKTEIKVGPLGGGILIVKNLPTGEFVSSVFTPSSDNDINKNIGFDVYTGHLNPKDYDFKTGKVIDSYAPQPADVVDKQTKQHDKKYDEAGASGPADAFGNYSDKVLAADKQLAVNSLDIVGYYLVGLLSGNTPTDIETGKPITVGTAAKALVVGTLFGVITAYKTVANALFGGESTTPAPANQAPASTAPAATPAPASGGSTDDATKKKSGG